jgi:DNA-binding transcriptional MerR regulator
MVKTLNIGELSNVLNVSPSTLRYWESIGIINPKKNKVNSYREYDFSDIMNLSDVLFYKNLGLELKQIKNIEKLSIEDHKTMLNEKLTNIEIQLAEIKKQSARIKNQLKAISIIDELKSHPYQEYNLSIPEIIIDFKLVEKNKLMEYIKNPYVFSRVQHTNNIEHEFRGIAVPSSDWEGHFKSQILWKKNSHKYIRCLMKEEIIESFPNNIQEHLNIIQRNFKTGYIINRFLICGQENNKVYDYYEMFVEIFD